LEATASALRTVSEPFVEAMVLLGVEALAVSVTEAWAVAYVPAAPTEAEVQLVEEPPDVQAKLILGEKANE